MRILMVTSSYPRFEGDTIAPFIRYIAKNIAANGHIIDLLMPYNPIMKLPEDKGINYHIYKYAPIKSWNIWGYAASLRADIKVKKRVYLLIPSVAISTFLHLMHLTRENNYDILHVHWVLPNGPVAALIAGIRRLPLVISLHGSDVFMAARGRFYSFLAGSCFKRASWITACSDDLRWRAIKLGASEERIETIPYGVDLDRFKADSTTRDFVIQQLKIPSEAKVIFTAGRLVYKKGFEYLIRALPQVLGFNDKVRLVIAGEGDLKDELIRLSRNLGVSQYVIFPGSLPHHIIPQYYSASDMIVVPSIRDQWGNVDGLPNVLMEAMASGKPIVASRIAGIPQVVHQGENGLLVEEKNPHQLAEAIIKVLKSERLSQKLGQQAREKCRQSFDWKLIAKKFLQGYNEVLKNRRGS